MNTNMDRRTFIGATGIVGAAAINPATAVARNSALAVLRLNTAQLHNPIGLTDDTPSLSWQLAGERREITQKAYRIQVASTSVVLSSGRADLWDSGRVESGVSTGVPYGGRPLASRQRAWWTVTVWDDKGVSAVASEPAFWERALSADDWTAQWLAAESPEDRADREAGMPFFLGPVPAKGQPLFVRLPFSTDRAGEAVLTLFSSGFLQNVTIDGAALEMPPHPFASFGGPPAVRVDMRLAAGRHMLAAEVSPPRGLQPATEIAVAALLDLPGNTGGTVRLNHGWQTRPSVPEGWRLAGTSDSGWSDLPLQQPQAHAPWPAGPAVAMRHRFQASQAGPARLYVAALGAHDMRINGHPVTQDRLQSESSDYRKTILYRAYDVSDLVKPGDNVLAALVGDGWYASYMAPAGRYAFGAAPRRLIAQLEICGVVVAQTGEGWRMTQSPIRSSDLYDGEHYDARREQRGWDAPGFDDQAWTPCWTIDAPQGRLVPQSSPAVRITRKVSPVKITAIRSGVSVVDMGQNFAGLARLKVKGKVGSTVTMRFAEILKADMTIDQSNLRAAQATDSYTLRGDAAGETYTPFFTFHGFRYVQVECAETADWSIQGQVMGSSLEETGMLRVDNPVIQKLWLNTLWSQRSNFLAIPTDCPQRDERLGWTGDAQVFWDTAAFNMDVAAFTRRFLGDLRDAQSPMGAFPIFAPRVSGPPGASPGWSDAGVMLPWICWRRYGDTAMVLEHWDAMTRYVDGIIAANPDMIWRKVIGPNFGDWLALDAKKPGDETTPKDLVGTAMLKRSLDQVADMAAAIGKPAQASDYRAKADATARAFQTAFIESDETIGNGSQASYILALSCGMLTDQQKRKAGELLAIDIRRRGTLLSTGFLGTPLSLDAIADSGRTDIVYDLLLRTEFPSWGYMVKHGATTIWERWNGDTGDVAMNSFNHYALGAVAGFLYRRIVGIEGMEPGFARVRIAPLLDARVPSASADYDSVRGRISVSWNQNRKGLELSATIPANTCAELHLDVPVGKRLREGGREIHTTSVPRLIKSDAGSAIVEMGSGTWEFTIA